MVSKRARACKVRSVCAHAAAAVGATGAKNLVAAVRLLVWPPSSPRETLADQSSSPLPPAQQQQWRRRLQPRRRRRRRRRRPMARTKALVASHRRRASFLVVSSPRRLANQPVGRPPPPLTRPARRRRRRRRPAIAREHEVTNDCRRHRLIQPSASARHSTSVTQAPNRRANVYGARAIATCTECAARRLSPPSCSLAHACARVHRVYASFCVQPLLSTAAAVVFTIAERPPTVSPKQNDRCSDVDEQNAQSFSLLSLLRARRQYAADRRSVD